MFFRSSSVISPNDDFAARVIGRSMEPFLLDQDLVQLTPVSNGEVQIGEICAFRMGLNLVVHRLREITNEGFWFQGDRQPFGELIGRDQKIWRVERILARPENPRVDRLVIGLLNQCDKFEKWSFPKNTLLNWDLSGIKKFAREQNVFAQISSFWRLSQLGLEQSHWQEAIILKPAIKPAIKPASGKRQDDAAEGLAFCRLIIKNWGRHLAPTYYLAQQIKDSPERIENIWQHCRGQSDRMAVAISLALVNEWWNFDLREVLVKQISTSEKIRLKFFTLIFFNSFTIIEQSGFRSWLFSSLAALRP